MDVIAIEYIVAILSAMIGFFAVTKPVRKGVKWAWAKTLGRRGAQLDRIESELTPNGGTSMKDAINRIEERQMGFEAFQTAHLNTQDVAILRTDIKGKVYMINRQYQRMTGYSIDEVRGDGWINAIDPNNRDKVAEDWHHAVESCRELSEDILFRHVNGESFWAHANVYKEVDSKGTHRGYLGVIVPIRNEDEVCPHLEVCRLGAVNNAKITREESKS